MSHADDVSRPSQHCRVKQSGPAYLVTVGLAACLAVTATAGCRSGDDDAGQQAERQTRQEEDAGEAPEQQDMDEKRNAYGLPLPPKYTNLRRYEGSVQLQTEMSLDELVEFYEARLVDYEILRPQGWKLRIVGLREFMASIKGHKYGPVVTLNYLPAREKPEPKGLAEADAGHGGGSGTRRAGRDGREREPRINTKSTAQHWAKEFHGNGGRQDGQPVRIRTPEGELLAPGAVWGEPYTPPEGTPLHQDQYRANFGRPFGEWSLP